MTPEQLTQYVREGKPVDFTDTMQVVTDYYEYQPVTFSNGLDSEQIINEAGTNEGSCKIFALGLLLELPEEETLELFGKYYHQDVLNHPTGQDHMNIRTFMKFGWSGIHFNEMPLKRRS